MTDNEIVKLVAETDRMVAILRRLKSLSACLRAACAYTATMHAQEDWQREIGETDDLIREIAKG